MRERIRKPTNKAIQLLAVAILFVCQTAHGQQSYNAKAGMVPDKETAIAIADIILSKIYGKANIQREKPFNVKLKQDVKPKGDFWQVTGSLPKPPPGLVATGGVAVIEIYKKDGRIRRVFHEE
jgi:hypothetical protein